MHLERIVVDVVLLLSGASFSPIANMTALVLVSAMRVEFVIAIKALPAEAALGMSLETTLVDCARVVIAELLVLAQILWGE